MTSGEALESTGTRESGLDAPRPLIDSGDNESVEVGDNYRRSFEASASDNHLQPNVPGEAKASEIDATEAHQHAARSTVSKAVEQPTFLAESAGGKIVIQSASELHKLLVPGEVKMASPKSEGKLWDDSLEATPRSAHGGGGGDSFSPAAHHDGDAEAAAVRIQALQRGRMVRARVKLSQQRPPTPATPKGMNLSWSSQSGRPVSNQSKVHSSMVSNRGSAFAAPLGSSDVGQSDQSVRGHVRGFDGCSRQPHQDIAATKIQAIVRGWFGRQAAAQVRQDRRDDEALERIWQAQQEVAAVLGSSEVTCHTPLGTAFADSDMDALSRAQNALANIKGVASGSGSAGHHSDALGQRMCTASSEERTSGSAASSDVAWDAPAATQPFGRAPSSSPAGGEAPALCEDEHERGCVLQRMPLLPWEQREAGASPASAGLTLMHTLPKGSEGIEASEGAFWERSPSGGPIERSAPCETAQGKQAQLAGSDKTGFKEMKDNVDQETLQAMLKAKHQAIRKEAHDRQKRRAEEERKRSEELRAYLRCEEERRQAAMVRQEEEQRLQKEHRRRKMEEEKRKRSENLRRIRELSAGPSKAATLHHRMEAEYSKRAQNEEQERRAAALEERHKIYRQQAQQEGNQKPAQGLASSSQRQSQGSNTPARKSSNSSAQTRSARGHLEKPRHKPAPLQVTENIELGGISQGIPSRYPIPLQMGRIGAQEGFSTFIGSPGMAYNEEGMYGYEMTDSPDKRKRRHSPLFASPAAAGPAGRTYSTDVDPNSGWEEFGGPQSLSSACESPWGSRKDW
eukprot:CAMPEP_0177592348 /NCGR_PEP_ID=MMETSP0419_2-20121207/8507_1 /TAXON_ID=582737 /ORGANISM="Tetraselmis sp., Strain GSL018" /LENGTH=796 /DNA_ID=CAMNT_0019083199 /DNA_START=651 /DNA_END=3038 /DNA_ORIENTATION=+